MINRRIIRGHTNGQSRLDYDTELREFVDDAIMHFTFAELAEECAKRFGKERAPSKSALHRYWHRKRKQQVNALAEAAGGAPGDG